MVALISQQQKAGSGCMQTNTNIIYYHKIFHKKRTSNGRNVTRKAVVVIKAVIVIRTAALWTHGHTTIKM